MSSYWKSQNSSHSAKGRKFCQKRYSDITLVKSEFISVNISERSDKHFVNTADSYFQLFDANEHKISSRYRSVVQVKSYVNVTHTFFSSSSAVTEKIKKNICQNDNDCNGFRHSLKMFWYEYFFRVETFFVELWYSLP